MKQNRIYCSAIYVLAVLTLTFTLKASQTAARDPWPAITRQSRPWAYWWWMASAVDRTNLTRELQRYQQAGMGGIHIIPIYGAKSFEDKFIDYLSPKWMEMLDHTVTEANRLDLGVDMTTGTGWCFGGPKVTDQEANASVVSRSFEVTAGQKLEEKFDRGALQALMAFSPGGKSEDLMARITADGVCRLVTCRWHVAGLCDFTKAFRPEGQKSGARGTGPYAQLVLPSSGPALPRRVRGRVCRLYRSQATRDVSRLVRIPL